MIDAIEDVKEESKEEYYAQSLKKLKKEYKVKEMKRLLVELNNARDEEKAEIKQKIAELTKLSI